MWLRKPIFAVGILTLGICCEAQDARTLLSSTLAKYKKVAAYHLEGTRETSRADDIQRNWEREYFNLARASSNRYHYEIKAPDQWNIVVADGSVEWTFQPWKNEYSQRSQVGRESKNENGSTVEYFVVHTAQHYIEDPSRFTVDTATFLPEEELTIGGQRVPCYVIRATYKHAEDDPIPKHVPQWTFWIEKKRLLIRKETLVARNSASVLQPLHEVDETETTYYTTVDLERAPTELLTFSAPSGATKVRKLFLNDRNIDLSGFPAPALRLQTLDDKPFDYTSIKGHPIIVDFWASWCVPCVQQMESLARLAGDFQKAGISLIGVNIYDDPNTALKFLKEHSYSWTNLKADSETSSAWMLNGVPLVAIIDAEGTIAYYHSGYEEPEETAMLGVLQKINPMFATKATPCQTMAEH